MDLSKIAIFKSLAAPPLHRHFIHQTSLILHAKLQKKLKIQIASTGPFEDHSIELWNEYCAKIKKFALENPSLSHGLLNSKSYKIAQRVVEHFSPENGHSFQKTFSIFMLFKKFLQNIKKIALAIFPPLVPKETSSFIGPNSENKSRIVELETSAISAELPVTKMLISRNSVSISAHTYNTDFVHSEHDIPKKT